jgi:hypothetical protein
MDQEARQAAARRAVTRIMAANAERDDDFQDLAMGEIILAFDAFRPLFHDRQPGIEPDPRAFEGDLAATGDDPLLDTLRELARELDASPEKIEELCGQVLAVSGEEIQRPVTAFGGPSRTRSGV